MQCSGARIFSRKSGFGGHQKANFSLARAETALAKAFLSRGARAKKGHILTVLTCDKTCKMFVLTAHFQFSVEVRRSAGLELEHIFWLKLGGGVHPWCDLAQWRDSSEDPLQVTLIQRACVRQTAMDSAL